ncbi:MAG: NAD-dependent epimerase/dehydratase family protein [Wenyingzhuangia sp.]|jgi:dihydroflavonol-4-reductase|uniref:NAD-dependent epimerase/dehydratase family protein n=1 Tax=Wenyingzhuangia sp. TaxID=1964193 RepID=UPI00321A83C4
MILVTGGTGLVGAHLLYKLSKTNDRLVALYRNENKKKTTQEIFELHNAASLFDKIIWKKADVTDLPALEIAFDEITHVYHAAAMVSFSQKDQEQMRKTNIEGTANIVNLCISRNLKKLCYVSSIATLSQNPGKPLMDENCEWNPEEDHSDYSLSKFGGETEVWRGSQEGLDVVIVNPGVIFGFGAWNINTGKLFNQIKKGLQFYTKGSTGVVDVLDVTEAMILLMNGSIKNERFVIVSENLSFKDIFTLIANKTGVKPPKFKIGKTVTEIMWRINNVLSVLTFGKFQMKIDKYSAKSAQKKRVYDGSKITRDTEFRYTPFDKTIEEIASKLS